MENGEWRIENWGAAGLSTVMGMGDLVGAALGGGGVGADVARVISASNVTISNTTGLREHTVYEFRKPGGAYSGIPRRFRFSSPRFYAGQVAGYATYGAINGVADTDTLKVEWESIGVLSKFSLREGALGDGSRTVSLIWRTPGDGPQADSPFLIYQDRSQFAAGDIVDIVNAFCGTSYSSIGSIVGSKSAMQLVYDTSGARQLFNYSPLFHECLMNAPGTVNETFTASATMYLNATPVSAQLYDSVCYVSSITLRGSSYAGFTFALRDSSNNTLAGATVYGYSSDYPTEYADAKLGILVPNVNSLISPRAVSVTVGATAEITTIHW
jgi:hypothetical protein